ncbi:MAG: cation-translocating P-type ATPase [Parachlamydia sp.]|jgi:Ca2+-transporting ATPase|nr:cation-translocating P-type ATPase [Parachlamydia sp.]
MMTHKTNNSANNWCLQSEQEVIRNLNTDSHQGLSTSEAGNRLKEFGLNQLPEPLRVSALHLFFAQFSNFIVWILIFAAAIAGVLREWIDALAIITIVILNALLGFFQEYKAEKSLAALRKMVTRSSKVFRDGKLQMLPSKKIVPGDLVLIEAGDHIPADGRLIKSFGLFAQEAALTGESLPIHKSSGALEGQNLTVGDKKNMGFLGTVAVSGKGYMIVTETGTETELGKIASLLQQGSEEQTPLQKRLHELGIRLAWISLGVVSLVFAFGFLKGTPLVENFLISISLAVAAIPEGLPTIVTIALSIGVHKMAKRNALVRRLPSVETLGCTTVICTDKTGTLTENEMTVRSIWINNTYIDVTGIGYSPKGNFEINHLATSPSNIPGLLMALKIGILCNSAELHQTEDDFKNWNITGDPTEGALLALAGKANLFKQPLEAENPLIFEIPFDSEKKRMSMARTTSEGPILFIKGAADIILARTESILLNGQIEPLTIEHKKNIVDANAYLASQALRVLALSYRPVPQNAKIDLSLEDKMIFVGLVAMMDPPRPEVKKAVEICQKAGIATVMITGDHKETAIAVGKELDLLKSDSIILTGAELEKMDDNDLKNCLRNVAIYARVSATDKLRIVRAWKSLGEVVAMTGDGVNDAPALKEANIGIAMGITGTDVTKEASDMVITDDNFASIVNAVEEGRGIYDNITKFVCYLASSNIAEIMVVFMGMLVGFSDIAGNPFVPLSAVQILWINLASDGLPAIALAVDPINPMAMKRFPRKPADPIISRQKALHLFLISFIIAIGTLAACYSGMNKSGELAQTMSFTTLVVLELVAVQVIRSQYNISIFSNPLIFAAVALSFLMQLCIVYTPFLQRVFKTVPLSASDWGIILGITIIVWILCNLVNRLFKWQTKNSKMPY